MTNSNNSGTVITGFVLSARAYGFLKWFVLVFLPAISALYYGLSLIWPGIPYAEQVVGSLALLATFLGLTLGVSDRNYKAQGADGSLEATIDGEDVVLSRLALPNITAEDLAKRKSVTIQVNGPSQ